MRITIVRPVVVLMTMASLLAPTVIAQQGVQQDVVIDADVDGEEPTEGEAKSVRIYYLKRADGRALPDMLSSVSPDARIAFDSTTNRILVMASPPEQKRLEKLIGELDALPSSESSIKVFNLINADANDMLEVVSQIAEGMIGNGANLKLAVDPRTNDLIAAGSAADLAVIEALLLRLDEKQGGDTLADRTFRVRIVWFAEGEASTVKQDDDLMAVQRELSRIGYESLRPVGQTVVSAEAGGKFHIHCSAVLDDRAADLTLQGNLVLRQSIPRLAIEILAERVPAAQDSDKGDAGRAELVRLATDIAAPLGDYVVLGVTPASEESIAFAVQVALPPRP